MTLHAGNCMSAEVSVLTVVLHIEGGSSESLSYGQEEQTLLL